MHLSASDAPSDTDTDTDTSRYRAPPVLPTPTTLAHQLVNQALINFSNISDADLGIYSQALIHQTKLDGTVSQCGII